MAATTTDSCVGNGSSKLGREEIQDAIAKAAELRALHAALVLGGGSPASLRFSTASSPHHLPHFSAQDYPVFTPSYDEEGPLPGYKHLQLENNLNYAETCDEYSVGGGKGTESGNVSVKSDYYYYYQKPKSSLRNAFAATSANTESPNSFADQQSVVHGAAEFSKIGKNPCNVVVPLSDSSAQPQQPKNKGLIFSWLRKKIKNEFSPLRTASESEDIGSTSIEALKKEVMAANEDRDAALMEVAETKSSIGEIRGKLEYLERYCGELKQALRLAIQSSSKEDSPVKLINKSLPRIVEGGNSMPVSEEVMLEGFLQVVSEARQSVKQFCETLISHTTTVETNNDNASLTDNLNLLLQPYRLTLHSKYSKAVLYHLEGIINQTLYEDFENCSFQKNGAPKHLSPEQERHSQFSSFAALRSLSWNEVLKRGTKYYSEELSRFCDQKMSSIITALKWNRQWPERLLQAFFVSAKCIWLLHLLAFSFCPPVVILRVEENRPFDSHFMDDVFGDRQKSQGPSRVKVMVMPGFYVHDRVLRCKVISRYKSAA
ncbi:unnamed protein product [Cuscuta campestris]|uniref:IRK-interacting protein n=1 Tax=Cuscuta campestris TaxID=132261 RepID=A0A484LFW1_9ASTE|nr:unnamed protein product [Cuscuta campestris]